MKALCLDDEQSLLVMLVNAVKKSPDIDCVEGFRFSDEAIKWAKDNKPDVAFLDMQLRGCTGIDVAKQLMQFDPDISIVFCTGYKEYAIDAFEIHASAYILKPITYEAVQKEIDFAKSKMKAHKSDFLMRAQCFGNFDVFVDDKPLKFKRKKSKEVLAYLIDRKGASVSAKEICAVIWEDDTDEEKNLMYFYKLIADLKNTFTEAGISDVLIKGNQEYAVDAKLIDCDYYRYLDGDDKAYNEFRGEYMSQYSWAEETCATIE